MALSPDADLLVIGAGPAGTAAAITARRNGQSVIVIDRAEFPRDKTCGDGLTTNGLRLLESLDVPHSALGASAAVTTVMVIAPSGHELRLPLPDTGDHARVMRRIDLDAVLVERARAAGADVIERAELTELKSHASGVEATLADGRVLQTPFAVAADGNYSTARKLLGGDLEPVRGEWSAFRQYFTDVNDDRLWVIFERDLLPGYAWVFPLPDGRANVGLAMVRGPGVNGKTLAAAWRGLLDRPSLRRVLGPLASPEGPHRAWPIPSRLDPARLAQGRVLFAGDAAGVVDPMTGEGIAQALETGILAARAITHVPSPPVGHRSQFDPGSIATRYRTDVHRALGRDLAFAQRLQQTMARPRAASAALRVIDANAWTRRNFARWMFEGYPRALLLTPNRWRRGMFTEPGAYTRAD